MNEITAMTTAEMVAEYNTLTGKSIKKFSSRSAGEKQLAAARSATVVEPELDFGDSRLNEIYGTLNCPHCGVHLSNGVGHHEDDLNGKIIRHNEFQFECLACGEEFGPAIRKVASSASRAAAVANSWVNPEVKAARAARHRVNVQNTDTGHMMYFTSVAKAFRQLGLPMNKHIQFRGELAKKGTNVLNTHKFLVFTLA